MSNIIDSIQLSGVTYTISGQSSGGSPTVELTQAEYDALVSAGTVQEDTYYIITDSSIDYINSAQCQSQIDTSISGKADTSAVTEAIDAAVSGKVSTNDFNAYSGATDTLINSKASQSDLNSLSGTVTGHTSNTNIHLTSAEKTNIDSLATNIAAISGITATKVGNWDTAYTNNHTHSNKSALDAITGNVGTMAYENVSSYSSATEVNSALGNKLGISEFNTYSGSVNTTINSKASQSDLNSLSGTVTGHTANTAIHVTSSEKQVWNAKSDFSGSYNDLTDKPTIPTSASQLTNDSGYITSGDAQTQIDNSISGKVDTTTFNTYSGNVETSLSGKQDTLVSGTNIKTINNTSILGSGNIDIQGGGGKAIEAGRGISVTTGETADTVSFNLPIYSNSDSDIICGDESSHAFSGKHNNNFITGYGHFIKGGVIAAGNVSRNSFFGMDNTIQNTRNTTQLNNSAVFGRTNYILNASNAFASGHGNQVNNDYEFVSGRYNVSNTGSTDADRTLFSVGNGTADARHNAFEIRQNGDIYLTKDGQDVKLQDNLGGGGGITSGEVQSMIDESISGKTDESAFTAHTADTTVHVTSAEKATWNAKSDFSGNYNDLTDKPTIPIVPTNVSAFNNDAGYITSNDISGKTNQSDFVSHSGNTTMHVTASEKSTWNNKSDFSGNYNDLSNKPTIPTSASQLTNDSGYITSSALDGYATEAYVTAATNDMATKTWVGQQGYLTQHQDISGKQDVSGMTAYTTTATTNTLSGTVTAHTADTTIHVTSAEKATWNAKSDFSGDYNDLSNKLSAGTNITIVDNVISAEGGGSITIDPSLDSGSTNAVANSAITTALNAKSDKGNFNNFIFTSMNGNAGAMFKKDNGGSKTLWLSKINGTKVFEISDIHQATNFSLVETSAITTSISSSSTDAQVPSAKAVYDIVGNIETLLSQI